MPLADYKPDIAYGITYTFTPIPMPASLIFKSISLFFLPWNRNIIVVIDPLFRSCVAG